MILNAYRDIFEERTEVYMSFFFFSLCLSCVFDSMMNPSYVLIFRLT